MPQIRRRQEGFARRHWRRIAVLLIFGTLAGGVTWLWRSGTIDRANARTHEAFLNITAQSGFAVKNLLVEGRAHVDPEVLRRLLDVSYGDSVFALDIKDKLEEIEKISWIEKAEIQRRLPDTIYVKIYERRPVAFWQREKRLSLIDENGKVITDSGLDEFGALPIVVGEDAADHVHDFLQLVAAEPDIFRRMEAAVRVGQRRWDIKLDNDLRIKLPEKDMALAIRVLARLQKDENIFDKNITVIDLRLPEKLVVQTAPQAADALQFVSQKNGKNI